MPKVTHGAGLIQLQKDITGNLDNTPGNNNSVLTGGRFANALLVGQDGSSTGAVKITFADGTEDTIPYLVPGIWHNMAPFKHVYATGTTADSVRVGVTF
jgi:hypothetical protein